MTSNELEQLKKDKRVAEELLFMVLNEYGKPFVVDLPKAREAVSAGDNAIDISIDEERDVCILQVVPLHDVPDV